MKPSIWIVIVGLALLLWFLARERRPKMTAQADPKIYSGLRDLILHGSREKLGISPRSKSTEPWGVVMDWGIPTGTATVVALADGTASVYLSSGGGLIGGGQSHESIRNAAKQVVEIANEVQPSMHATSDYPLPQNGQVMFYLLSDSGVFTGAASDEDMRGHRNPLYKLGDAAQNVITEYRRIQ